MRDQRQTNAVIGCLAVGLLIGFVVSFAVTAATQGLAETCSTWVVVPVMVVIGIVAGR